MKNEWIEKFIARKDTHCWNIDDGFEMADGVIGIRHSGGECVEKSATRPEIKSVVKNLFADLVRYDTARIEMPTMKKLTELSVMSSWGVRHVELEAGHYYGLEQLKEMKRAFPKGNWYMIPCKGWLSPLYVIDDDGNMGVLMPRRP